MRPKRSPSAVFLMHWTGVERDELLVPMHDLRSAGVEVFIASPQARAIQTVVTDLEADVIVPADVDLDTLDLTDFDVAVFPGGVVNADRLRMNRAAVQALCGFAELGKPVAMICHAPWLLVETDLLPGKTLTSYPSLRTDLINAGADWIDEPVVCSDTDAWRLITSRRPIDLHHFANEIVDSLSTSS
nr:DJ-1/PfpI family protein [Mycobacteroides abscessus]